MVGRQLELVHLARAFEGVGAGFVKSGRQHEVLDLLADALVAVQAAQGRLLAGQQAGLDVVIAIDPGRFFGQVSLAEQVGAPAGRMGRKSRVFARDGDLQPFQAGQQIVLRQVRAQDAIDTVPAKRDRGRFGLDRPGVDQARTDAAGPDLFDQLAGPVDRARGVVHVKAFLEASRRFRTKPDPLSRPPDRQWVEGGRFQQHGRGCCCHF